MKEPLKKVPTLGLAMSGSGNRTAFYIGFLEEFLKAGQKIDYIAACSGGSLVAAAYACGNLFEVKDMVLKMNFKDFSAIMTKKRGKGGLYSLDFFEDLLVEKFTKGKRFEEVKPIMVFTAVDIETGELVDLCMGDIARAARISCTTPALFEAVQWGNRVLVDGGVLSVIPYKSLKKFEPTVSVSIDLALTRNVFTGAQMSAKKIINFFKKYLLVNQVIDLIKKTLPEDEENGFEHKPKFFSVWGKSLDLAIHANKHYLDNEFADLIIEPNIEKLSRANLSSEAMWYYYEMGREEAIASLPKIKQLLLEKSKL